VVALPSLHAVEAAMRRIAEGSEPETYDERRPILEKLVDLRISYYDDDLQIDGKVPVAEAVDVSNRKNCNSSLGADPEGQGRNDRDHQTLGTRQRSRGNFQFPEEQPEVLDHDDSTSLGRSP
jgi:hypothetical protein